MCCSLRKPACLMAWHTGSSWLHKRGSMVRRTQQGSEAAQNAVSWLTWRRTMHAWPHCRHVSRLRGCPAEAQRWDGHLPLSMGSLHKRAFKHTPSDPQSKPEWIIWKLFCNGSRNDNYLCKLCPFGDPMTPIMPHPEQSPRSWTMVQAAAMISSGPLGSCVREQFVLWSRSHLPGWMYLLRMVIFKTESICFWF